MSVHLHRRSCLTLLGMAAAWPVAARAQQEGRVRRVGVLVSQLAADDPEWQARGTPFVQGLQERGWTEGRSVRIEMRWGTGDADRLRKHAAELIALAPDAILAAGNPAVEVLQQATRTLPVVFVNVADPVALGHVSSLARPGGNVTGFMSNEFGLEGKFLELLKQLAPGVRRVAVIRNPFNAGIGGLAAIQAVAPSFGVEVSPVLAGDPGEIEGSISAFVRGGNDGLIVTDGGVTQLRRSLIITLAAQHRLPAVYSARRFVIEGGLISYGPDRAEPYRLAASYIDRILRGEKPADLPVQAPVKYETVLNLKTAKALGLEIPPQVLVRADEVIE